MQEATPKVAKNECMDVETVRNRLTVVVGVLKNQTQGNLNVLDSKKWGGHVVKNYPNPLKIGMGIFGQGGLSYKGVEAAVVYSGKNRAGVDCFWLLAWAETKGLGHRVSTYITPYNNYGLYFSFFYSKQGSTKFSRKRYAYT